MPKNKRPHLKREALIASLPHGSPPSANDGKMPFN
jgi:hypothetical protein